jgi:hypothetical protein
MVEYSEHAKTDAYRVPVEILPAKQRYPLVELPQLQRLM